MDGIEAGACAARPCVLGLRVPADNEQRVEVLELKLTAAAFSDAIGGGLLEESLHGEADRKTYIVYLDEQRVAKGLPGNQRAALLAARLGHVHRDWMAELRGDVLILGCDRRLNDADVPDGVMEAAFRAGLLMDGRRVW